MTFKPGALVMLKKLNGHGLTPGTEHHVGTFKTLGERSPIYPQAWRFDPPVLINGRQISWEERAMKLIDPGSGTDETLIRCGLPHGETV